MNDSVIYRSPVGNIKVSCDHVGITGVEWVSSDTESRAEKTQNKHLTQAMTWLEYYFGKSEVKVEMPSLNFNKYSAFHTKVWRTLLEQTKDGVSLTYSQLAQLVGSPLAARAVGTAMKRNPIPLFIPCHRVLPKRGGMGSYSGGKGANTKRELLDHEARISKRRKTEE